MEELLQHVNTSTVIAALFVLALLYLVGRALVGPAKHAWRVALLSAWGIVLIVVANAAGQFFHVSVPINPFTVLLAGYLGPPGLLALVAIQFIL